MPLPKNSRRGPRRAILAPDFFLSFALAFALVLPGSLGARGLAAPSQPLRGRIVDAATGRPVAARLYVQSIADRSWHFARATGEGPAAVEYRKKNWVNPHSVEMHTSLPARPFELRLPPGRYRLTVERGKEYRTLEREVTVAGRPVEVRLELERWIDLASLGWYSGDTHVHRSLQELPVAQLAEDLNVSLPLVWWVTVSGTPPATGDKSSKPPERALIPIDATHVIATRNTEYEIFRVGARRHSLGAFFALDHGEPLERGVPPVRPVARAAHRQGALLDLDKHDWPWSIALVEIAGIDLFEVANNHMWRTEFAFRNWSTPGADWMGLPDGPRSGGELAWVRYGLRTWYALLDCGYPLRPSAGTASGVHPVPLGFSRVYVHVEGKFEFAKWRKGLGEGRSFVTTGPALLVRAEGKLPGAVLRPAKGESAKVHLSGRAAGARPLTRIEIVVNGRVVRSITPANELSERGALETPIDETVEVGGSSWIAARAFEERPGGRARFAHTAPFRVEVEGRPLRPRREEVEFLVRRVRDEIDRSRGVVPPEALAEYEEALRAFEALREKAR